MQRLKALKYNESTVEHSTCIVFASVARSTNEAKTETRQYLQVNGFPSWIFPSSTSWHSLEFHSFCLIFLMQFLFISTEMGDSSNAT